MKKFEKGFTLIELLLCLAIIGIVSAFGMTITKRTTAKAYNLFYYTGYTNLYDVINEIGGLSGTVDECAEKLNTYLGKTDKDGKPQEVQTEGSSKVIETMNGIKYALSQSNGKYVVMMSVPAAKTKANQGYETTKLVYVPEGTVTGVAGSLLVPIAGGSVNLLERKDLLPTYIDDGGVSDKPIVYYSYKDAFCRLSKNHNLTAMLPLSNYTVAETGIEFPFAKAFAKTVKPGSDNPGDIGYDGPDLGHDADPIDEMQGPEDGLQKFPIKDLTGDGDGDGDDDMVQPGWPGNNGGSTLIYCADPLYTMTQLPNGRAEGILKVASPLKAR